LTGILNFKKKVLFMVKETSGTKLSLIIAAGELFAEHGLNGVGVRTISVKAHANIAAINYHFGSKENLYMEVLRYINREICDLQIIINMEDVKKLKSRKKITELIRKIVKSQFDIFYSDDNPKWYGRLILKSLFDSTPEFVEIVRELFIPEYELVKNLALLLNPTISEDEARHWALSLFAMILHYAISEKLICIVLDVEEYNNEILDFAADFVTRMCVETLMHKR
jgi:TetR/AcrR family transcriptional regulator, regulator of cefoperazone and chloramphenicol sensitivity